MSDNVESIGALAFEYCNNLSKVYLSNNLKDIGEGAFKYCPILSEINIPQSTVSIKANTFDNTDTSNIGIMKTGWQYINSYWYYFNTKNDGGIEGLMNKGWKCINGTWYYFYYEDGKMATDT